MLQSVPAATRQSYEDLKKALQEKFVPTERMELHKAEFRARRRGKEEKLPTSIRRVVKKAYQKPVRFCRIIWRSSTP